jgi:prepilin-type N-terminal cleavage/methylation domain-containing protein
MSKGWKADRGGFTLVEVMVAMLVLTTGILAMAASTGFIFSRLKEAGGRTERALVIQQVADSLRSVPSTVPLNDDGNRRKGRYTVSWQVSDVSPKLKRVRIVTVGPGYVSGRGMVANLADTTYTSLSR